MHSDFKFKKSSFSKSLFKGQFLIRILHYCQEKVREKIELKWKKLVVIWGSCCNFSISFFKIRARFLFFKLGPKRDSFSHWFVWAWGEEKIKISHCFLPEVDVKRFWHSNKFWGAGEGSVGFFIFILKPISQKQVWLIFFTPVFCHCVDQNLHVCLEQNLEVESKQHASLCFRCSNELLRKK